MEIGVIQEVGDLGLGFEPLTEQEQNKIKIKEQEKKDKK